jgi:hypothetical protein
MPEKWLIVVTVALGFTLAVLAWWDEIRYSMRRLKWAISDNPVSRWLRRELRRRLEQRSGRNDFPTGGRMGGVGGRMGGVGERIGSVTDWHLAMQIGVSVALLGADSDEVGRAFRLMSAT